MGVMEVGLSESQGYLEMALAQSLGSWWPSGPWGPQFYILCLSRSALIPGEAWK